MVSSRKPHARCLEKVSFFSNGGNGMVRAADLTAARAMKQQLPAPRTIPGVGFGARPAQRQLDGDAGADAQVVDRAGAEDGRAVGIIVAAEMVVVGETV